MPSLNWSEIDPFGVFQKLYFNEPQDPNLGFVLRSTGFVHLVSASGIHLYALFAWTRSGARALFGFSRFSETFSARAANALGFLACVYAWHLSQYRLGLFRPFLIVAMRACAEGAGHRFRRLAPLALALIADLILESAFPFLSGESGGIGDAMPRTGRLHYAVAVGFGLLAYERRRTHLSLAVGSWFGTALLDLFESGRVSFWTPLVSWLTIPIFATLSYPVGLLLCALGLESAFSDWIAWNSKGLESLVRALAALPLWGVVDRAPAATAAVGSAIWIAANRSKRRSESRLKHPLAVCAGMGVAGLLVFGIAAGNNRSRADRVIQWDVGQGDAALIVAGGRAYLIDVGPEFSKKRWLEALQKEGVAELSAVVLTHQDSDHAGGLERLLPLIPIRRLYADPGDWQARAPAHWDVWADRARVERFSNAELDANEPAGLFRTRALDEGFRKGIPNSGVRSLEARLQGGGVYLNMGDASSLHEARYARLRGPRHEPVRVLKVSHHGSRFASHIRFAEALRPERAWISSGKNRYGHPSQEALSAWGRTAARVERTDRSGDLSWRAPWTDFQGAFFRGLFSSAAFGANVVSRDSVMKR